MSYLEGSYMLGGDGFMLGGAKKSKKIKVKTPLEYKKTKTATKKINVKTPLEYKKTKTATKKTELKDIVKGLSEKHKKEYKSVMSTLLKNHPNKSLEARRKMALGMLGLDDDDYHIKERLNGLNRKKISSISDKQQLALHKALKAIGLGYAL